MRDISDAYKHDTKAPLSVPCDRPASAATRPTPSAPTDSAASSCPQPYSSASNPTRVNSCQAIRKRGSCHRGKRQRCIPSLCVRVVVRVAGLYVCPKHGRWCQDFPPLPVSNRETLQPRYQYAVRRNGNQTTHVQQK